MILGGFWQVSDSLYHNSLGWVHNSNVFFKIFIKYFAQKFINMIFDKFHFHLLYK